MKKQTKVRILTITLCSLLLLPIAVVGITMMMPTGTITDYSVELPEEDSGSDISLGWKGVVSVSKNGVLVYQGTNLLTDAGADHIKLCLGTGGCGTGAFDYIALGNGTVPTTGSTTLDSEIAESGLERAQADYTSLGTGHWKLEEIFTATGTVNSIHTVGLFNASSSGTMIAGNNFSSVNMENADSLNITWDITQS